MNKNWVCQRINDLHNLRLNRPIFCGVRPIFVGDRSAPRLFEFQITFAVPYKTVHIVPDSTLIGQIGNMCLDKISPLIFPIISSRFEPIRFVGAFQISLSVDGKSNGNLTSIFLVTFPQQYTGGSQVKK